MSRAGPDVCPWCKGVGNHKPNFDCRVPSPHAALAELSAEVAMTYHCHACRSAPLTEAALIEHIQTCEKHPLAAALRANAALSDCLEVCGMWVSDPQVAACDGAESAYRAIRAAIATHGVVRVTASQTPAPPLRR